MWKFFAKSSVLAAAVLVLGTGCSAPIEEDETAEGSHELTAERAGDDVTVLQGFVGETVGRVYPNGYQLGDRALDLSRCNGSDCTGAAQSLLASTLLGRFPYSADSSGQCETIEIRTIVKRAAFDAPSFRGIGFYVSSVGTVFVSKERLVSRGDSGAVTLKDGTEALVHRFVAQGMCFGLGGNGGSIYSRSYQWKPYAQFEDGDSTYKIWDGVPTDYHLGRTREGAWVQSFDRQGELLRQ